MCVDVSESDEDYQQLCSTSREGGKRGYGKLGCSMYENTHCQLFILRKRMATLHTKEKIQLSGGFPPVSLDGRERGTKEKGGGRQLSSAKHKLHTERQSWGGEGVL